MDLFRRLLASLFVLFSAAGLAATEITVHQGDLKGAPYTVATPVGWKGGPVFFHVNGWRSDDAPHLADLDTDDPFYQKLFASGWAVARTAFLKNGVDHDAHTLALRDLKTWIEAELGPATTVLLEGESTAGTLVLRIAERDPDLAHGVIAKGAFIRFDDATDDSFLTAAPRIPAFLMSNLSEIEGPVAYVARATSASARPSLRPLLRPGHVNVNWAERWAAVQDMQAWLRSGSYPNFSDGSRPVPPRETGTETREGALVNRVTATNVFFGNAFLGYHPDEFAAAGIQKNDTFTLETHGKTWPVLFGQSYGDVPLGEWVAFPTADDQILLVRNHKSAIATAGLNPGDTVVVRRKQSSE